MREIKQKTGQLRQIYIECLLNVEHHPDIDREFQFQPLVVETHTGSGEREEERTPNMVRVMIN